MPFFLAVDVLLDLIEVDVDWCAHDLHKEEGPLAGLGGGINDPVRRFMQTLERHRLWRAFRAFIGAPTSVPQTDECDRVPNIAGIARGPVELSPQPFACRPVAQLV